MRLFRRQGYASTGLQQILSESGVPKGSLYHYFPGGKEALGEAAVEMAGELIAEMLEGLIAKHPDDPAAFLSGYCRTMAKWMTESEFASGCPIATTVLETVPASETITRAANVALDRWVGVIARVFVGETPQRARGRAETIVAGIEGALILARIRRSPRPLLDLPKTLAATLDY